MSERITHYYTNFGEVPAWQRDQFPLCRHPQGKRMVSWKKVNCPECIKVFKERKLEHLLMGGNEG